MAGLETGFRVWGSGFRVHGSGFRVGGSVFEGWGVRLVEYIPQRVHVGIWYTLRAQKGSHIPTLRPKYIPYTYMDPLGT